MSFMVPLGTNNDTCSELAKVKLDLAKEELDKQVHDKQLVRILKCGQLHASGYMINPASKFAYICNDVINIRSYVKANAEKFKSLVRRHIVRYVNSSYLYYYPSFLSHLRLLFSRL